MTDRDTPHRGYSAAIFERQLDRFRKTLLDKRKSIYEVALSSAVRSHENCKRLELNGALRDAFIVSDLNLPDAGNHDFLKTEPSSHSLTPA
jgi:hypothetical protein